VFSLPFLPHVSLCFVLLGHFPTCLTSTVWCLCFSLYLTLSRTVFIYTLPALSAFYFPLLSGVSLGLLLVTHRVVCPWFCMYMLRCAINSSKKKAYPHGCFRTFSSFSTVRSPAINNNTSSLPFRTTEQTAHNNVQTNN